tara:strand:- start:41707 stop:44034 length:2328 start_codon:yes stop_codon:yes gene_type:complete
VESLEASVAEDRLDKLAKQGGKTERATDSLAKTALGLKVALTATAGAAVYMIRQTAAQEKELKKLATLANSTTDAFAGFAYATDSVGISAEKLGDISKDVQDKLGDFIATGGGEFADFFENVAPKVGVTAEELAKLSGPEALIAVKKAMDNANVSAAEQTFYLESIANDAALLTPLLKDNGQAMREKAEEARKLGIVLNEIDSESLVEAGVATQQFDRALGGLTKQVSAYLAPAFTAATDTITEDIARINQAFASGEIDYYISAIGAQFEGVVDDVDRSVDIIGDILSSAPGEWGKYFELATNFFGDAFENIIPNIRATVQIMAVEWASIIDYADAYGSAFVDTFIAYIADLIPRAKVYAQALGEALNPFSDDTFNLEGELAKLDSEFDKTYDNIWKTAKDSAERTKQVRLDSISGILDERDATIQASEEMIQAAENVRKKYEESRSARRQNEDEPSGAVTTPFEPESGGDGGSNKDFENLVEQLRTEEEVINESYQRRKEIILANTEENSQARQDLLDRLNDQYATDIMGQFATPTTSEDELTRINDDFEARRAAIMENTELTETQRTELELELTKARNDKIEALENARMRMMLNAGSQGFGALADLTKQFVGEQSGAYKALFAASKAFSVAEAVINIQQGISEAISLGWPAMIPAVAAVTAQSAGLINTIQSTNYSGAYDNGGYIPTGKFGIVGEYGPEFVEGPAQVTSRRDTRRKIEEAAEGGGGAKQPTNIRIINTLDPAVVEDYLTSSSGEEVIMNVMSNNRSTLKQMVS